jgi:hypothetical protein
MIQGWNWYAGADPTQIGAGQYDFETTVLHELGHALGLGGSTDPSSPMYETLAAGVTNRTVTTQDLNIPDPPEGADPQMAAGFNFRPSTGFSAPNGTAAAPSSAPSPGTASLMPLLPVDIPSSGPWSMVSGPVPLVSGPVDSLAGSEHSLVVQGTDPAHDRGRLLTESGGSGRVLDLVLDELADDADQLPDEPGVGVTGVLALPRAGNLEDGLGLEGILTDDSWLTPVSTGPLSQQPAWSMGQPASNDQAGFARRVVPSRSLPQVGRGLMLTSPRAAWGSDRALDEVAADAAELRRRSAGIPYPQAPGDSIAQEDRPGTSGGGLARLAAALLVTAFWGHPGRIRGVTTARRPCASGARRSRGAVRCAGHAPGSGEAAGL